MCLKALKNQEGVRLVILQSKPLLEGTVESFKGYKTLSNV